MKIDKIKLGFQVVDFKDRNGVHCNPQETGKRLLLHLIRFAKTGEL